MATQVSLNSGAVASAGALALQTNGTTEAVSISTGQVATLAQNPILTSGTANSVQYLNATKAVTSDANFVYTTTGLGIGTSSPSEKLQVVGKILATGDGRIGVKKDGSDSVGLGPFFGMEKGDATRAWFMQLGASNTFDWWYYSGGASYTKYMTLDSSGNLGLGTVGAKVNFATTGSATQNYVGVASDGYSLELATLRGASQPIAYKLDYGNGHVWSIAGSSAMTLDASGNLIVGGTSTVAKLTVNGSQINYGTNPFLAFSNVYNNTPCYFQFNTTSGLLDIFNAGTGTNGVIKFSTGAGTEAARINSSGEIAAVSAGSFGLRQIVTAGAGTSIAIFVGACSGTAGNTGSGTDTFIVWSNGNVVNTNNSYGQISDVKLKENIVDATPKLKQLNQVRVVNFNFINDTKKQLGVIAQELEQIFPGMVDESPDLDKEGNDLGTTTKSVKYSVFVPMLIKALQEQQSIINTLTDRITALEGTKA